MLRILLDRGGGDGCCGGDCGGGGREGAAEMNGAVGGAR